MKSYNQIPNSLSLIKNNSSINENHCRLYFLASCNEDLIIYRYRTKAKPVMTHDRNRKRSSRLVLKSNLFVIISYYVYKMSYKNIRTICCICDYRHR